MDQVDRELSDRDAALKLQMVPGVGPRIYGQLLERFGSAKNALRAAPAEIRSVSGIGTKLCTNIVMAEEQNDVAPVIEMCREHDIAILQREDQAYPNRLKEIIDPPNVLFSKGNLLPCDELSIAIVGTRHASQYGLKVAEQLARGLSMAGLTIVSGLARGIDAAAHRGALKAGGRTIGVLGSGVLRMYPPEHVDLAAQVMKQGAVLSESLPHHPPKSGSFPQRNRVVTGLSLGVIVVEAGDRSGALISARLANEQGREVFAVPGRIDNRMSRGTHRLLRDGATLVECVEDVLDSLGPLPTPATVSNSKGETQSIRSAAELKLNEQEMRVLQLISEEATEIDWIIQQTELPASRVLATVSILEVRRLVRRVSGTALVRV
jgi:DNA processing protein